MRVTRCLRLSIDSPREKGHTNNNNKAWGLWEGGAGFVILSDKALFYHQIYHFDQIYHLYHLSERRHVGRRPQVRVLLKPMIPIELSDDEEMGEACEHCC